MATRNRTSSAQPIPLPKGYRRLLLCFDGTWNTLDSQTNVLRLFRALATAETACGDQLAFYDEGVGTEHGNSFRGGFRGHGLGKNVLEGYCWLVDNYKHGALKPDQFDHLSPDVDIPAEMRSERFSHGDLIFLIGFSRGAFTARSLAGMINRVGILDRSKIPGLEPGHPVTADAPLVQRAWQLYRESARGSDRPRRYRPREVKFRAEYSHNVKVACVAVWDTVGALGIPITAGTLFDRSRSRYAFHDSSLGRTIEHGYHAVAIDEHRPDFEATLWTLGKDGIVWARDLEQRWFAGAHANVGGGYDDDLLCERPLHWMAQKLADLGVLFRRDRDDPPYHAEPPKEFLPDGNEYLSPVRDSFKAFVGGFYPTLLKLVRRRRHYRRMLVQADGIAQVIDPSARLKWDVDPDYRPINLAMAGRTDAEPPIATRRELSVAQGDGR